MAEKVKKPSKVRWRGVMAQDDRIARIVVFIVLAVASAALAFTQLGFAGIGLSGNYVAYAVTLLLPVSLAALLLGTGLGTLMGLLAGAILLIHAKVMPLDFYELTFVSVFSSIVILTISGFLLGVLFAFALRNNPSHLRRVIYIAIVCLIVSMLFSINFMMNVIGTLVLYAIGIASSVPSTSAVAMMQNEAISLAMRLGNIDAQILADAALMTLVCVLSDYVVRKMHERKGEVGLRTLFNSWLTVVVFVAFMITASVSFVFITEDQRQDALGDAQNEAGYLLGQIDDSNERAEALSAFLEDIDLSDDMALGDSELSNLGRALSDENLLQGYTIEKDGVVMVLYAPEAIDGSLITHTDDSSFHMYARLDRSVSADVVAAIEQSVATQELQRIVYDWGYEARIAERSEEMQGEVDLALSQEEADADVRGAASEAQVDAQTSGTLADASSEAEESLERAEAEVQEDSRLGRGSVIDSTLAYLYAERQNDYIVAIIKSSDQVFAARGAVMAWSTIMSLVLLLAVYVLTAQLLKRLVVDRITETNDVLGKITEGDLNQRAKVHDTREFTLLSEGINQTVEALQGWIAEAETRIDTELATAKAIQESALPRIFPPYPDILKFDIYASMHAAREVGGDFYDFFLIGDDADGEQGKLGFLIADVSGKGIPAALFMMNAKALVSGYIKSGVELGEAIENANHQLCDGNDEDMFVTLFAGVLDYETNAISFVNAGHNPPLLWHAGSWTWLKERSGMPLGLFDGMPYKAYELSCEIGDQLLLYTDGVTEAMNVSGDQYGEARLEAIASRSYPMHPRELIGQVRHDVATFTDGAEQSDDITIVALEVGVPPEVTATLTVPASVDELPRVNEFIHNELNRRLCPLRAQNQLDIAVEELFVNVAHYAYPDADAQHPGMVRVSYTYSADPPSIAVDIADDGIAYNPLEKPDAVTPDDIMDVPIGGLGILMAKRSVDEMRYERIDGSNIVTIIKKW